LILLWQLAAGMLDRIQADYDAFQDRDAAVGGDVWSNGGGLDSRQSTPRVQRTLSATLCQF
jgi:hypothetical protein